MPHTYALPSAIRERLEAALRGRRNAAAVLALATFLGRMHSHPAVLGRAFPIDRRALAGRAELGLSEGQIRAAVEALVEVGFLLRPPLGAGGYQPTAEGLRRKPVQFRFGLEVEGLLRAAFSLRAVRAANRSIAHQTNRPTSITQSRVMVVSQKQNPLRKPYPSESLGRQAAEDRLATLREEIAAEAATGKLTLSAAALGATPGTSATRPSPQAPSSPAGCSRWRPSRPGWSS